MRVLVVVGMAVSLLVATQFVEAGSGSIASCSGSVSAPLSCAGSVSTPLSCSGTVQARPRLFKRAPVRSFFSRIVSRRSCGG